MKRLMGLCVLVSVALGGCSNLNALMVLSRDTDRFVMLKSDPRILLEASAHTTAKNLSEELSNAIAQVELSHDRNFTKPIQIYLCATANCMRHFGAPNTQVAGFVLNQRLFLSANARATHKGLVGVLTHELSHLHLSQQLGMISYTRLPSWFKEGLAVNASGGAGAERVNAATAYRAIKRGHHFAPATHDNLAFPTTASDYGLKPHMFYRQSALFLQYLKRCAPRSYHAFLRAVQDGEAFEDSFRRFYRGTLDHYWQQFVATI